MRYSALLAALLASLALNGWLLFRTVVPPDESVLSFHVYNETLGAAYHVEKALATAQQTGDPVEKRQALLRAMRWAHVADTRWRHFWERPTREWVLPRGGPVVQRLTRAFRDATIGIDELLADSQKSQAVDEQALASLATAFESALKGLPFQVASADEFKAVMATSLNPVAR